jgi:hypothetical protein
MPCEVRCGLVLLIIIKYMLWNTLVESAYILYPGKRNNILKLNIFSAVLIILERIEYRTFKVYWFCVCRLWPSELLQMQNFYSF